MGGLFGADQDPKSMTERTCSACGGKQELRTDHSGNTWLHVRLGWTGRMETSKECWTSPSVKPPYTGAVVLYFPPEDHDDMDTPYPAMIHRARQLPSGEWRVHLTVFVEDEIWYRPEVEYSALPTDDEYWTWIPEEM